MNLKTLKLILWSLVIVLCATGFITQIKYVSDRYMEYKTKTIVEMMIPTSLTMFPFVSVCWSFPSLINESTIKVFQPNINMSNKNEIKIILSKIKINEIFDITPKENGIIENRTESCMIRYQNDFSSKSGNRIQCNDRFNIVKYLERQYVCYKFLPKSNVGSLKMVQYTLSPHYDGEMYRIWLNTELFKKPGPISFSVHAHESSNIFDSVFSSNHYHRAIAYPGVRIFYREVQRIQLEAPYDTMCVKIFGNYPTGFEHKLDRVNNDTMNMYGFAIPFIQIYDKNLPYRLIHDIDLRNKTIANQINILLRKHHTLKGCITKYVDTTADVVDDKWPFIAIFWPQNEKLSLQNAPDQELIDYIVYIGSCIGIWFGLSAYSLHDGMNILIDLFHQNDSKHQNDLANRNILASGSSNIPLVNQRHINRTNHRINYISHALWKQISMMNQLKESIEKQSIFQEMIDTRFDSMEKKISEINRVQNQQVKMNKKNGPK